MKRFFIFSFLLNALFCGLPASAQQTLNADSLDSYLKNRFEAARPQTDPHKKQWQVLVIKNSADHTLWDDIDETRKEMERQIRKGNLARGVLLYSRENGDTYIDVFPRQKMKEALTNRDTPEIQYTQVDVSRQTVQEVLNTLFKNLKSDHNQYYTAVYVNAHGDGHAMKSYMNTKDSEKSFYISQFITAMNMHRIKADYFQLASCYMGTIHTVNQLLTKTDIGYLMTSSNAAIAETTQSKVSTGPILLLKYLDETPQKLAINVTKQKIRESISRSALRHNFMLWDGNKYREEVAYPLAQWIRSWKQSGEKLDIPAISGGRPVYFFKGLLNVVKNSGPANEPLRTAARELHDKINTPILGYFCHDYKNKNFTDINSVPENSRCIAGTSVDNKTLKELSNS